MQSVPAWYTGQKELSIENAMQFDTSVWVPTAGSAEYEYSDGDGTITISVAEVDTNTTATVEDIIDGGADGYALLEMDDDTKIIDTPTAGKTPWLIVKLDAGDDAGIVHTLKEDMKVQDAAIPISGRRVKW